MKPYVSFKVHLSVLESTSEGDGDPLSRWHSLILTNFIRNIPFKTYLSLSITQGIDWPEIQSSSIIHQVIEHIMAAIMNVRNCNSGQSLPFSWIMKEMKWKRKSDIRPSCSSDSYFYTVTDGTKLKAIMILHKEWLIWYWGERTHRFLNWIQAFFLTTFNNCFNCIWIYFSVFASL